MKPLISINISCLNRSKLLKECLESFIAQTFKDFEIIVVDDGSEEDLSFVTKIDERIKYFRQEHGGMATALNLATSASIGSLLMPFGSDDLALPELLQETIDYMDKNNDFDVIYTDCWVENKDGGRIRNKHPEYDNPQEAYEQMLRKQFISHGGTLWKKECYPAYDETVGPAEDWEFFLDAMEKGIRFKRLAKRLWVYKNFNEDRMSNNVAKMNESCEKVLRRRGYTFDSKTRSGKVCRQSL